MKKEIQEKYESFQELDQEIKQIQQQHTLIQNQLNDLMKIEESLKEISHIEPNTELVVPLGSGVFFKCILKDNKEVLLNIGANTIVKKKVEEAQEIIQNQVNSLNELATSLEEEATKRIVQIRELGEEIQKEREK